MSCYLELIYGYVVNTHAVALVSMQATATISSVHNQITTLQIYLPS